MLTAGVDIGGTKVFAVLVDENGSICQRASHPTDPDAGTASIVLALDQLIGRAGPDDRPGTGSDPRSSSVSSSRPGAIGIAAAAYVAYPSGRIAFAPNLVYGQSDVAEAVRRRFQVDVIVENDANAAAWAEQQYGAGRGSDDTLMLTIGTGIGGGVVVRGELFRGHLGYAGEFGHITLVDGGPLCACGERGCLEALASGNAIGRMAREGIAGAPDSILLELAGDEPGRITGALVSEAAHAGDEFAAEVLQRAGRWLGTGLATLVNAFDPSVIVIGGSGAAAGWFLLEPARLELDRRLGRRRPVPPIVTAVLGNDAGAIGAASLARLRTAGHEPGTPLSGDDRGGSRGE
jgi:glucokinase